MAYRQATGRRFSQELGEVAANAIGAEPFLAQVLDPRAHAVALPQRLFRRPRPPHASPPIADMVTVGRDAATVRLRTYLWLFALASLRSDPGAPLRITTGRLAELLNLYPTPTEAKAPRTRELAARRVANAVRYLEGDELLRRGPGRTIGLLDPDRNGQPLSLWDRHEIEDRQAKHDRYASEWPFDDIRQTPYWERPPLTVPLSVWTNGTVSCLRAPALTVLLVLLDRERLAPGTPVLMPKIRRSEYGLSADLWRAGVAELIDFKIIGRREVRDKLVFAKGVNDSVSRNRYRVAWTIHHPRLEGTRREQNDR